MSVTVASTGLNDEDFLAALDSCTLPLASFRHGDHLRLAWLQLHKHEPDEALALIRSGILKFAAHNGVPHIFHETITTAWVKLLATHQETSFAEFINVNSHRLNGALLHRFWTPSLLDSDAARQGWVPPDREALPH
jgi:hypothetical protein